MRVPIFKAKDKDSDKIVEGFYFNFPVMGTDETAVSHNIITFQPSAMGFVNEPMACSIDPTTLEYVRFYDIPVGNERIII